MKEAIDLLISRLVNEDKQGWYCTVCGFRNSHSQGCELYRVEMALDNVEHEVIKVLGYSR